ncbi:MAG: hypothetical protein CW716_07820 [Candidatus Bathyarchaeum sp.]|nr:MAG: hypothetical protein CW716_07820 [Candidatus Bathyarchaeum sp.]
MTAHVQGPERSVLIHGTKLRPPPCAYVDWDGVLNMMKHITVNELNELVETIARVNTKSCNS